MARAIWSGMVIAESGQTEVVEGNHYFPADSVNRDCLKESETTSVCPWKGTASYYHVHANGEVLSDAAWYYPAPKEAAKNIQNHIAFWKGVKVEA